MINNAKHKIERLVSSTVKKELSELTSLVRENYWANVFNSSIKGIGWIQNIPLNVGRWAANYSLLYILFRILNEVRPSNILELGLGETTKIIQAYKQFYNKTTICTTIEHNRDWIDAKIRSGISTDVINIIQVDTVEAIFDSNSESTLIYKDLVEVLKPQNKFDLLLIDGPFGSEHKSRYNAVELVKERMISENFIIIIDDAHRKGEKETLQILFEVLKQQQYSFEVGRYSGEKDQVMIMSEKYKYLSSL